jgi:predicted alternative tryptophan synthase beta-subunit
VHEGLVEARPRRSSQRSKPAWTFARTEGIVPAPESSHAIRR